MNKIKLDIREIVDLLECENLLEQTKIINVNMEGNFFKKIIKKIILKINRWYFKDYLNKQYEFNKELLELLKKKI